jgi:acetyl-CoA carboxylase biotin carboxyl carrier protein
MARKPKMESGAGVDARGVDLAEVKRLLEFMRENGLEEFEYQRGDVHIRLRKTASQSQTPSRPAPQAEQGVRESPSTAAAAPVGESTSTSAAQPADLHLVKSPIVGTFYAAPSPEAEPFVAAGARVEVGQVLCIIEAMKLMNEIESEVAGEVVKTFIENGHPVEYGETLFSIRVTAKK